MFKNAVEIPGEDFWAKSCRCALCDEILTLKIYYCEKGHFMCHRCSDLNRKCSCGGKVTKLQATFLENIVRQTRFMCELDCGTLLTNDEYHFHVEEACRCRPVHCPVCTQLINYRDYMHHLKRLHNIERVDLKDGKCPIEIKHDTQPIKYTLFEGQTFFIRWAGNKLWTQSYERSNNISIEVEGQDFNCTLKPAKLHAELYEADSVTLKLNDSVGLTFSCTRNGNTVTPSFRFSL